MSATIRAGRISAINYKAGKATVVYTDKNEAVTRELPFLAAEYAMPAVGDMVVVLHMDTDTTRGLILGRFYSATTSPVEGAAGLYRKEMDVTPGVAMMRYTPAGSLLIKAPTITLQGTAGSITVAKLLATLSNHEERLAAAEAAIAALQGRVGTLESTVAAQGGQLASLEGRVAALGG